MGRVMDLLSATKNAVMDKVEKPELMLGYYVSKSEEQLESMKMDTADAIVRAREVERELDAINKKISDCDKYARKAVMAGNDDDAVAYITRHGELMKEKEKLELLHNSLCENAGHMLDMNDKLAKDIKDLKHRQSSILADKTIADNQVRVRNIINGHSGSNSYMTKFENAEGKVTSYVDRIEALNEIDKLSESKQLEELSDKYENQHRAEEIELKLSALKAELGVEDTAD